MFFLTGLGIGLGIGLAIGVVGGVVLLHLTEMAADSPSRNEHPVWEECEGDDCQLCRLGTFEFHGDGAGSMTSVN